MTSERVIKYRYRCRDERGHLMRIPTETVVYANSLGHALQKIVPLLPENADEVEVWKID